MMISTIGHVRNMHRKLLKITMMRAEEICLVIETEVLGIISGAPYLSTMHAGTEVVLSSNFLQF